MPKIMPSSERELLAPMVAIALSKALKGTAARQLAREANFIARYVIALTTEKSKRKRRGYFNVLSSVATNYGLDLIGDVDKDPHRVGLQIDGGADIFIYPI